MNNKLDAIGAPCLMTERVQVCYKLFKLPRFKTEALLTGMILDPKSIQTIADELAVRVDWLLENNDQMH